MSDPVAVAPAPPGYRRLTVVGLALVAGLALAVWWTPHWGERLQAAGFDAYQLLRPRAVASMPATVVEIDEASLARLGQWPWPRTLLADLVQAIARHDPAAIGIDILMPEEDRLSPERLLARERAHDALLAQRLDALRSNDEMLARAIAGAPVVLGLAGTPHATARAPRGPPVVVIDPRGGGARGVRDLPIPQFAGVLASREVIERAATGHGAISAAPADDVIRRLPLVVGVADRIVPALSIEMLRVALRAPDVRVHLRGSAVEAIAVGDFVVPTEADGALRLHYAKPDPRRRVSAVDVLDGRVDPETLARKLVLIGTTGLAIVDYQHTPLRERMPGSEIHAQALENLYEGAWLVRPRWARVAELAVFVALGLMLVAGIPRCRPGGAAALGLACVVLPLAAGLAAYLARRLVLDAAVPALALALLFGSLLMLALADAARVRRALERDLQRQREHAAFVAGEMEAAKRVQVGFLPRSDAIADARVDIAATMQPARLVGGDLYDFFLLDGDRLFFLIGDVAGKGLSASLFMAVGKALYKTVTLRSPHAPVGEIMRIANDEIARDNPELFFVTAFAGILELATGRLAYCNAGHENPYLADATGTRCERVDDGGGPPLCALAAFAYPTGERRLAPGEMLCLVTDGVIDAQDAQGTRYGSERVRALVCRQRGAHATARGLVDALCADVARFAAGREPVDDLTVLALGWRGPRGAA